MKNKWIIGLPLAVLFSATILRAQSISLRENNLDQAKNLSLLLSPIGVDAYAQNFNLYAEGKLMYRLKKERAWITANYRIAYLDRTEENSIVETEAATQPLKELGAVIGYNFIRKEKIQIATPAFYTRRNKIRLPVRFMRTYGVHAGYSQFRTIFASGSTTSYTGTINVGDSIRTIETSATPMFSTNIVHVGIHRQWLENYVIEQVESDHTKKTVGKSIKTIYADFFYAPFMNFDPVYKAMGKNSPNSDPNYSGSLAPFSYNYYPVNVNLGPRKIPIGARIGVDITELVGFGYNYSFEFGFRPGIYSPIDNLYLLAKIGFSINGKLK